MLRLLRSLSPDAYRTESALDPLRDREDFRLHVMDLAMLAEPLARLPADGPPAGIATGRPFRRFGAGL